MDIKYIYYEIKYITGINSTTPHIENENILLIKPHTNSDGIWGFTSMTERKGFSKPTFSIVEQYWIDLDKFDIETNYINIQVKIVLEKLKKALQTQHTE